VSEFKIAGKNGFIRIEINEVFGFPTETRFNGGYDVKGKVEIKSGNYYVNEGELWFSTGQIFEFFIKLQKCYDKIDGNVIELEFIKLGQIQIQGYFQEFPSIENILEFEFESDQSYLASTLVELKKIVDCYGDLKGIKE